MGSVGTHTQVHTLFNFLIESRSTDSARDVPLLLAPRPFAFATLRRVRCQDAPSLRFL